MNIYPSNSVPHPARDADSVRREAEKWEVSKAGILARRKVLAELLIQVEDCLSAATDLAPGVLWGSGATREKS